MAFDRVIKILDEEIEKLAIDAINEEKKTQEIGRFQEVIRAIEKEPFILYTTQGEPFIKLLGLDEKQISGYRKIYEGYIRFGRENIPHIKLVEDENEKIKVDLLKKVQFLSDVIAKHQANILRVSRYKKLFAELNDENSYITQIDVLIELFKNSSFSFEDKNNFLREVNTRNVILQKQSEKETELIDELEVDEANTDYESLYAKEAREIKQQLEKDFGSQSLKHLYSINDFIKGQKDKEEVRLILSGWAYSFSKSINDILDGIIALKRIDILELKDNFEEEEVASEIELINEQIMILNGYKQESDMQELINTNTDNNDYERAVLEYNPDLLSYPVKVLFLNNTVGKELENIEDMETLRDLFVLLENIKKGTEYSKFLEAFDKLKQTDPQKHGHQARIRYQMLTPDVCVVVQMIGKKADKTRREQETLELRLKALRAKEKDITADPKSFDEHLEITRKYSDRLFNTISKEKNSKVGGLA